MTTSILGNLRQLRQTQRLVRTMAGIVLTIPAACLAGGCARSVATTTVHPNGSWVRTVTFHGSKPSTDGSGGFGTAISDAFVLPAGAGWKVTHADTKDEAVVIAERTLEPGEILRGDITAKGKKTPLPTATNEVIVRKTAPGIFEYKETLHWKGPMPKTLTPDAETVAAFKKALPPALATDANARALATESARDLWRVMFGPGDPLVSQFSALLSQPELVERRVQQRIGAILEKHLEAKFGTQLDAAQRRATARAIIHDSLFKITNQTKNRGPGAEAPPKEDDDSSQGTSLFIAVKLPGRIIATNGERDDVNGEVFWALYPEAAVLGDVTMTATCDTNAQSALRR